MSAYEWEQFFAELDRLYEEAYSKARLEDTRTSFFESA